MNIKSFSVILVKASRIYVSQPSSVLANHIYKENADEKSDVSDSLKTAILRTTFVCGVALVSDDL